MRAGPLGRVGLRIAAPVALLSVVLVVLLSWMLSYEAGESSSTTSDAYARLLSSIAISHLRDAMQAEDRARLQGEIARIADLEPIRNVRIIDKKGVVAYDSDARFVGARLTLQDPSCSVCHVEGGPANVDEQTMNVVVDGKRVVRALRSIVVEAECVRCHELPEGSALGVLITDLDVGALTGGLENRTGLAVLLVIVMTLLVMGVLMWSIRRLVVARVRNLRRMLDRLRSGARSLPLLRGSRDEIDDLARSLEAFVLDLDEQLALQHSATAIARVIEAHPAPVLLLDRAYQVVVCNRRAVAWLAKVGGNSIVGQSRQDLASMRLDLLETAGEEGQALPTGDDEGPVILALRDRRDELLCYLEVWPARSVDADPESELEVEEPAVEHGARNSEWLIYAATLLEQIRHSARKRQPGSSVDSHLAEARRMVSELAWSAGSLQARNEVELGAVGILSLQDLKQAYPSLQWHTLLDPPVSVFGTRYQLRALTVRLLDAAARSAGPLGDVLLFAQVHSSGEKVFLSAWASQPGGEAILDPPGRPPLAMMIARAHGGGVEVDPRFDIRKLADFRGIRLACEPVGSLYVAELALDEDA